MKVVLILNNNALLVVSDIGEEVIVRAKGIGFQYKKGDLVDLDKVEKVYHLQNEKDKEDYNYLLNKLPAEYLELSDKIFTFATKIFGINFPLSAVVALTDHLSFAIDRYKNNLVTRNALGVIVEQLYPNEYQVGEFALLQTKLDLGLELPEEEASNIALHFINYTNKVSQLYEAIQTTKAVKDIVNIVRFTFINEIVENSLAYSRFLTHVQFFVHRLTSGTYFAHGDEELYQQFSKKYPEALECALKIKDYVKSSFDIEVGEEEIIYLTVHINRLLLNR